MPLNILSECPSFSAKTQEGADFNFEEYASGSWVVLFSYPSDFTPVCSTEMADFARNHVEFKKRNCKVVGISTDSSESHLRWLDDVRKLGKHDVDFPVLSDETGEALDVLGLLQVQTANRETSKRTCGVISAVRGLYILNPAMTVQYVQIMPPAAGRNLHEIIRVLDAVQLSTLQNIATPAGWQAGQDVVLLPEASDSSKEATLQKINGPVNVVFPYLKFVQLQTSIV